MSSYPVNQYIPSSLHPSILLFLLFTPIHPSSNSPLISFLSASRFRSDLPVPPVSRMNSARSGSLNTLLRSSTSTSLPVTRSSRGRGRTCSFSSLSCSLPTAVVVVSYSIKAVKI